MRNMDISFQTWRQWQRCAWTLGSKEQQAKGASNINSYLTTKVHITYASTSLSNLHLWGIQEIVIQRAKGAASIAADKSPSTLIHSITRTTTKKVKTRETETILTAQQVIHKEDFTEKIVAYQKQHGQSKHLKP